MSSSVSSSPRMIIHVPHASTLIPAETRDQFILTDSELQMELDRLTDHFTDQLFAIDHPDVMTLQFPVSRFVVDPERFSNDNEEPMAARGQGVVYQKTTDGKPLRRALTAAERESLLAQWYRPHHAKLEQLTASALATHNQVLILDVHSFPDNALPVDMEQSPDRPYICIGTDEYHTPESLIDTMRTHFTKKYEVEINRPYAGSLVPLSSYRKDPRVSSIMIEVNRKLYLTLGIGMIQMAENIETLRHTLQGSIELGLTWIST